MMRRGRSSTALVLPVYGARLHARVTLLTRHTRARRGGRGLLLKTGIYSATIRGESSPIDSSRIEDI